MTDCIFCKFAMKEIPADIVYEDDKFIAMLDIRPRHTGHSLVIPKKHYGSFMDFSDEDAKEIGAVIKKVAIAIQKATGCDGINIVQNNGKAADQIVMHSHTHIIPRFEGDGDHAFENLKNPVDLPEGEWDRIKAAIIANL